MLLSQGAICLCMTTVAEQCYKGSTSSYLYGISRNPHDTTLTCGGVVRYTLVKIIYTLHTMNKVHCVCVKFVYTACFPPVNKNTKMCAMQKQTKKTTNVWKYLVNNDVLHLCWLSQWHRQITSIFIFHHRTEKNTTDTTHKKNSRQRQTQNKTLKIWRVGTPQKQTTTQPNHKMTDTTNTHVHK